MGPPVSTATNVLGRLVFITVDGYIAAVWIYSRSIAWEQILFILLVLDTVCTPEQGTNAGIVDLLAKKEKTLHGKYILMHLA